MPRIGRPPATSRPQILEAARAILDRDGWEKLTVRRLAAELGVGATTLYHHVRDKDDLLVQLLEHYADQLPRPELPSDPRERIVAAATLMHDALAAWPAIVEVLTADDFVGESALWMVDGIVGGALGCGCSPERAVAVYRGIWYYTLGELLIRARAGRRAAQDRPRYRDRVFAELDATRFPSLAIVGERWPELTARDTYQAGLRAFVDGLLAQESK
ncbi:TetR/AcrR family transcriptional regulator [Amycolatopsis sp. OK19-0408]|uniref:TetR/AcrR family transcriptional regulator n=1 Tax=Amycolatopsis iheyensis TaxID=2945988 RepID=A0A9X2NBZ4_9PSEU|nr:TetR/AcrR family transcriptional regulator [Amycolatopsis iheyensis]MCR6484503.1 TetR/AcrR family transcriptional regulator [Amycolatopsis iheyensis]